MHAHLKGPSILDGLHAVNIATLCRILQAKESNVRRSARTVKRTHCKCTRGWTQGSSPPILSWVLRRPGRGSCCGWSRSLALYTFWPTAAFRTLRCRGPRLSVAFGAVDGVSDGLTTDACSAESGLMACCGNVQAPPRLSNALQLVRSL